MRSAPTRPPRGPAPVRLHMNEDLGDAADLLTYSFPHAMGKLVRSNDRHERIDGDVEIHAYRAGNAAGAHPVHALHPRYRARRAGDHPTSATAASVSTAETSRSTPRPVQAITPAMPNTIWETRERKGRERPQMVFGIAGVIAWTGRGVLRDVSAV